MNRFWGGLLMAGGVLAVLLSGLCTLFFGAPMLLGGSQSQLLSSWLMLAISGAPPIAAGVGLILLGRRIGWPAKTATGPAARGGRRLTAAIMIAVGLVVAIGSVMTLISGLMNRVGVTALLPLASLAIGVGLTWGGAILWRDPQIQPATDVF